MIFLFELGKIQPKFFKWKRGYVKNMCLEWCNMFSNRRAEAEFDSQPGHLTTSKPGEYVENVRIRCGMPDILCQNDCRRTEHQYTDCTTDFDRKIGNDSAP
jgi:hypothetical protein